MLSTFTLVALSFLGSPILPDSLTPNSPLEDVLKSVATDYTGLKQVEKPTVLTSDEIKPKEPETQRLICKGCNADENRALIFLQDKGIKDKNALATIMGNIRQESMFIPNICEGGARTSYGGCGAGFGLIQWTSSDRYYGLGSHSRRIGKDPSTMEAQLDYMLVEPQWKQIESRMKTPGRSIDSYMNHAYSWIGWGIHGARTSYAYDYAKKLVLS
jgi:hypothetical protein